MVVLYETPGKPWEGIGTNLLTITNGNFICAVDYHSELPIAEYLSGESGITCCKIILAGYGLLRRTISDLSTNPFSEKLNKN